MQVKISLTKMDFLKSGLTHLDIAVGLNQNISRLTLCSKKKLSL